MGNCDRAWWWTFALPDVLLTGSLSRLHGPRTCPAIRLLVRGAAGSFDNGTSDTSGPRTKVVPSTATVRAGKIIRIRETAKRRAVFRETLGNKEPAEHEEHINSVILPSYTVYKNLKVAPHAVRDEAGRLHPHAKKARKTFASRHVRFAVNPFLAASDNPTHPQMRATTPLPLRMLSDRVRRSRHRPSAAAISPKAATVPISPRRGPDPKT